MSYNEWSVVFSKESKKLYEEQLVPFVEILLLKGHQISLENGDKYERALLRSILDFFENNLNL